MIDIAWQAWLVWVIPILGSLLVPFVIRIKGKVGHWLSVVIGFISALTAASMIPYVLNNNPLDLKASVPWLQIQSLNISFGVLLDPLSVFMANIATWIGALVLLYSIGYMSHEEGLERYYSLVLLFIGAMTGLVMADNFVQLFVFWEIVGICSYALIGFWYKRPTAVRAASKAFLVTKVGDVFLLIGILYLFTNVQSFNFIEINSAITALTTNSSFMAIALILISLGAMGKSAQIPFHVWLPDAMEGPTSVSALIHSATMVKAGVYLLARCSFTLIPLGIAQLTNLNLWYIMIIGVGSVTALLSATMALVSTDIKKALAYSTISQLGYMFAAIGFGTPDSLFASQFQVFSHALFKALLFLSAGSVVHAVATTNMQQMGGLKKYMPVTFMAAVVGALALSGVPPLSGFWSKDEILNSAFSTGYYLSFFLLITSAILTFAYSLRWVHMTFLSKESFSHETTHPHESPRVMLIPLLALASVSVIGGIFGRPLEEYFRIGGAGALNSVVLTTTFLALAVGGVTAYLIYFRNTISIGLFQQGLLGKIQTTISRGYYFDDFYNSVFIKGTFNISKLNMNLDVGFDKLINLIAAGTVKLGQATYDYVDVSLDRLTTLIAEGTVKLGRATYDYVDVGLDKSITLIAEGIVNQNKRISRLDTGFVQHFVLAVFLGLILLTVLMLITV
ncbi:MAG: NADH-quinone oxidoreductase subunit [Thermoproteota archaeon]|nr:NADH-quinone oxidoreductase subunit [Thermoproteota archaeon]